MNWGCFFKRFVYACRREEKQIGPQRIARITIMKLETKIKLIHRIWLAVPIIVAVTIGVMLLDGWVNSLPAAVETNTPTRTVASSPEPKVAVPESEIPATAPATKYESVEAYFKDGNPNPLTHRIGLPRYERDVSDATKRKIK